MAVFGAACLPVGHVPGSCLPARIRPDLSISFDTAVFVQMHPVKIARQHQHRYREQEPDQR